MNMENKLKDYFQLIRTESAERILTELKSVDINTLDDDGNSYLVEAISHNKPDIAEWLIKNNINVNIQNHKGMTSLHILPFHPNELIAEQLIENSGNLGLADNFGNTPLWYAVFNARGYYKIVSIYMAQNPNVNAKNKAGRSPLDFAMQINDSTLLEILGCI